MENILLIDKEVGWTSNDVVSKLKNILQPRPKKIGHAGTLDPFATGLLLIMLNEGTKKFDSLQGLKKEYVTEIEFGKETDTYDVTGQVVFENENIGTIDLDPEQIQKILEKNFSGKIQQVPPIFSALKIDGKRAYDIARKKGKVDELKEKFEEVKKREVEIYESEILKIEKNILTLRLVVSSGTYIRSVAHDLGQLTGYGAYCKSLRRTKIGEFYVSDAKKISDFLLK
jgi:tRNA pseudouridine55 synthase